MLHKRSVYGFQISQTVYYVYGSPLWMDNRLSAGRTQIILLKHHPFR